MEMYESFKHADLNIVVKKRRRERQYEEKK